MMNFRQMLQEMSFEAKLAKRKIEDLQFEISQHVMLIYLGTLTENENIDHWKAETLAWLRKINDIRIKPKQRKFSCETYYEILFNQPLNIGTENFINRVYTDMKFDNIYINLTKDNIIKMYQNIEKFYRSICTSLANNSFEPDLFNRLVTDYLK